MGYGAWQNMSIGELDRLADEVGVDPSALLARLVHRERDLALCVGE